jgi:hypothetical protein
MNNQPLSEKLRALDEELGRADVQTEAGRAAVDRLQAQMRPMLEAPDLDHSHDFDSLREVLDHAALHLDVEHPTLSAAIKSVLNELGAVGI